jgi:hypothetical protein
MPELGLTDPMGDDPPNPPIQWRTDGGDEDEAENGETDGGWAFYCYDCEGAQFSTGESRIDAIITHYEKVHGLGEG